MVAESAKTSATRPELQPLRFDVLTLFPGLFENFVGESILKRAIERKLVDVRIWNLRDWAPGKHHQVDDRPFGGGPGMVLMAPPVVDAVEQLQSSGDAKARLLAMCPRGRRLDQAWVRELATERRLLLICGRYEGIDQRVTDVLKPEALSIGDYVLCGGELAAMVVVESVMRLIPGVLGDDESSSDESFGPDGALEYPQYTRPREYRGLTVPDVLLSGDHAAIAAWRQSMKQPHTSEANPRRCP